MKSIAFIFLIMLAVWRVGVSVSWSPATLAGKFSNEYKPSYKESADECASVVSTKQGIYCYTKQKSQDFRFNASSRIQQVLPSPHSELVTGMVLGENNFNLIPTYNDVLKTVGLIHVVVVSGYNISLVFSLIIKILGSPYKSRNLVLGLLCTFIYSVISGFGIPAVRAWVMGSISVVFRYYGRPVLGINILLFSALVIICISPSQLFSVSFLLSFFATFGTMVLPPAISGLLSHIGVNKPSPFMEDFITSLSAQLMVNPVISYYFGTISLISVLVNPLVSWVIPLCTILGGVLVFVSFLSLTLARVFSLLIFPYLDFFVSVSELSAGFKLASVQMRFGVFSVLTYYTALALLILYLRRRFCGRTIRVVGL